mmetsp:Transcript_24821/g.81186  ORF Transcript_24821/g.81186 Transcript_24821/m.81186 type:complete len:207 (+) Transcript_24821:961-1581(+)
MNKANYCAALWCISTARLRGGGWARRSRLVCFERQLVVLCDEVCDEGELGVGALDGDGALLRVHRLGGAQEHVERLEDLREIEAEGRPAPVLGLEFDAAPVAHLQPLLRDAEALGGAVEEDFERQNEGFGAVATELEEPRGIAHAREHVRVRVERRVDGNAGRRRRCASGRVRHVRRSPRPRRQLPRHLRMSAGRLQAHRLLSRDD